jgi:ADP-ribose pyrophosphatase YjhB (NUDIX family)
MSAEPEKLFIGVVDFFSILLPGAVFTFLLKDDFAPRIFGQGYQEPAGNAGWVVFLVLSYLLGHFIFLVGSWMLDDGAYDPIRSATYYGQIRKLARGEQRPSRLARWLAARLITNPKRADMAVRQAEKLMQHHVGPIGSSAMNAFQWCKATLTLNHHESMAMVERFEADSKFFRSLVVVLFVIIAVALGSGRKLLAVVGAVLMAMAFWRYVDQRLKATNQAYWYVMTAEARADTGLKNLSDDRSHRSSRAGGVVYRVVDKRDKKKKIEYLLVRAKAKPEEWVLPKGHVEKGERQAEAAVREVLEEASVWARVKSRLDTVTFALDGERVSVDFYLMEYVAKEKGGEPGREPRWLPFADALKDASHVETRDLLTRAEQLLKSIDHESA